MPTTSSKNSLGTNNRASGATNWLALILLWLLVVLDGYDLIVYGTVQSTLLAQPDWGLTQSQAGLLGSTAFIGMAIGALSAGRISDSLGRKRTLIAVTVLFTLATLGCGLAPNPEVLGIMRLLAGLGLGGLIPAVMALSASLVSPRWRSTIATAMLSGVPIGGSIAALLGIPLISEYGWRVMFFIPVVATAVIFPLVLKFVPETLPADTQKTSGPTDKNAASGGFSQLLRLPFLPTAIGLSLAAMGTMFAWYGLGTWLPTLMEMKGYDLGSALTFSLALNLGAVAGSIITAWAGDRFSPMISGAVASGLAAGALFILMNGVPVPMIYLLLIIGGIGTHGSQILIAATVTTYFPENLRGTAVGWAFGVGRIGAILSPAIVGLILSLNNGVDVAFIAFAAAALLAAVMLLALIPLVHAISQAGNAASDSSEDVKLPKPPAVPEQKKGLPEPSRQLL